jgi:hypothetical protein
MTQNNNNPTIAPATSHTPTPAIQPTIVQPVKGDAAKVITAEKK